MTECANEYGFGLRRIAAEPLFELVEYDDDFAAGLLANGGAGISGVGIGREVSGEGFEGLKELAFGVVRGGFDEDGVHAAGESGEESGADQRRLPAAAGAINHAGCKGLLGVAFFELLFPEGEAFGESSAVAGAGEQLEEEGGIFFREGSEAAGNDGESVRGIGGLGSATFTVGFVEPVFEFCGEVGSGLVAIDGASSEGFEADAFEFTGDAAAEVAEGAG